MGLFVIFAGAAMAGINRAALLVVRASRKYEQVQAWGLVETMLAIWSDD